MMSPSDIPSNQRRGFLKALGGLTARLAAFPAFSSAQRGNNASSRPSGSKYMGDFAAPKLEKVKVAIIGVGARGSGHASQLASIEGVDFVGICDIREAQVKKAEANVTNRSIRTFTKGPPGPPSARFPKSRWSRTAIPRISRTSPVATGRPPSRWASLPNWFS